jgi:hypothetical protein
MVNPSVPMLELDSEALATLQPTWAVSNIYLYGTLMLNIPTLKEL